MKETIRTLLNALEAAQSHLEYCGYGGSYERECAYAEELPENIQAAIDKGHEALAKEG